MIRVDKLTKTFTRSVKSGKKVLKEEFRAVNEITFEIEKGSVFGILGPNGAGKTTLLRMLGGILTPTEGTIEIDGKNIMEMGQESKKIIGYLSNNTKLYDRMSIREILSMLGELYELDKGAIQKKSEAIFDLLDMHSFKDNRIEHLSTGQTQKSSIARCLIHSPEIYIFDEPTLGLDVMSSRTIIEFMKKEKQKGKTILYSTHYMEEAEALCDYILMIYEGQIIACGTKEEVKKQTETDNLRDAFLVAVDKRGDKPCDLIL